jgi:hypothetical protein
MPGFPLAAIGAGLGMFAQQYAQQKAAQERQQMLAITLARYQQEQKDRQGQNELANIDFGNISGGGQGFQPVGGASGGFPGGGAMPGGASSVGTSGGDPLSLIAKYESGGRNIKNPTSSASGPWQFINSTWREMAPKEGVDITKYPTAMSAPVDVQKRVAQRLYNEQGYSPWAPYNSRLAAAIGGGAGAGGSGMAAPRTQMASAGPQTITDAQQPTAGTAGAGGYRYDIGSDEARAAIGQGGVSGSERPMTAADTERANQMAQAGPQTETDAGPQGDLFAAEQAEIAKIPMPKAGGLDLSSMIRTIHQRAPNATLKQVQDYVHNIAAQRGPEVARQFDAELKQHDEAVSTIREKYRDLREGAKHTRDRREQLTDRAATGGQIFEGPTGLATVNPNYPERGVSPIPGSEGLQRPGSVRAGGKASRNVEVTDAEGKTVFRGAAHQGPQGWISDKDNQPIQIPEDGNIKLSSTSAGPGARAAQTIQRLTLAGNEVPAAMRNLVDLPITATSGIFAGLQQEKPADLADALKRTLANKLTEEDSQSVQVSFQGVSRALAILESAGSAQGLVGLTNRADVLMPRTGDTALTVLRKYAEIRQLTERALESVKASPEIGEKQGPFLDKMVKEIQDAVPWTVADVNKLQRSPDKQTVAAFARQTGASAGGASGSPYRSPDDVLRAIDSGALTPEAGKKIIIDQFGYTPKAAQ